MADVVDLTDEELAYIRSEVGATPDDDDLQERYERLGSVTDVIVEVLRGRRAAFVNAPASVNVPGEIAVNTSANITALDRQLDRLLAGDEAPGDGVEPAGPVVNRVPLSAPPRR
jgi:hypothetical protein